MNDPKPFEIWFDFDCWMVGFTIDRKFRALNLWVGPMCVSFTRGRAAPANLKETP